jgi:hypothetical protein
MLKRLPEHAFMAPSFLCSDTLWRCLDTSVLLGCIRSSVRADTSTVGGADALVLQTQAYNLLHTGFIQGQIATKDLDEAKIIKGAFLFLDLLQIIEELPMLEKHVPSDKVFRKRSLPGILLTFSLSKFALEWNALWNH